MKNWISVALLSVFAITNAQQDNTTPVENYPYIIVQRDFNGFENNEFKLKTLLTQQLKDKNYSVFSSVQNNWPEELINNPCLAVTANVVKIKSAFKNKLDVTFKDCKTNIIQTYNGTSSIKEFEPGYQEALSLALKKLPVSNPKLDALPQLTTPKKDKPAQPKETKNIPIENTNIEEPKISVSTTKIVVKETLFTDGNIAVNKIDLKDGGFILMNQETMQALAQFTPSLRANIYHVLVTGSKDQAKYQTIGYVNEQTISYEELENNTWKERIFKSK